MKTLSDVLLRGERVALRPVRPTDADALFPLVHGREDVLRWICWGGPESLETYREQLGAWRSDEGGASDYALAVVPIEGADAVGHLSLRFRGHPGTGDLGFWLGASARGRGLATEAIALAAHLAFEELGARDLVATVFVGNEPSRRALEKNGFRVVHTVEGMHRTRGGRPTEPVDEWQMALLASSWRRSHAVAPVEVRVARDEESAITGKTSPRAASSDAGGCSGGACGPRDRSGGRG